MIVWGVIPVLVKQFYIGFKQKLICGVSNSQNVFVRYTIMQSKNDEGKWKLLYSAHTMKFKGINKTVC